MKTLHVAPGVDLPLSVVTSKAAIMAMTGQGKTYLAKVIAEEMLKHGAQIVVGDYKGEWWGLTSSASGKRAGYNVVVFGGEHADVPMREDSGRAIADVVVNERINAILDVSGFEDDEPKIRFMTEFAYRLFFLNRRPIHFFLDEADEFVPQNPQRGQVRMLGILKRLWQRGRQKGIGGTIISQRPASVHKSLLTQSEILIALRTVGPQDRKALQAWFEAWGTEEQIAEFTRTIASVEDHHAWWWSPKHKLFKIAKARKATTFDSSRTPDAELGEEVEATVRTKHDIARLGKQLAAAVEEEKANDPAVLKKQLADLNDKFNELQIHAAHLELGITHSKAKKQARVVKTQVPVLRAGEDARLLKALDLASRLVDHAPKDLKMAEFQLHKQVDRLKEQIDRAHKLIAAATTPVIEEPAPVSVREGIQRMAGIEKPKVEIDVHAHVNDVREALKGDQGSMSSGDGRRRILSALAQHGGATANKTRVLAGIASMHTFRKYLGNLKSAGLVSGNGTRLALTQRGRDVLGEYTPLPVGKALVTYWLQELSGGHEALFRVLVSKPDYAFPSEELRTSAGIDSEHTFRKYLGRLKTLGLAVPMGAHFTAVAPEFRNL